MTPRQTRTRALTRHDSYATQGHGAPPPSAIELEMRAYAAWDAAPLTLTPIDIDCDPMIPAWMRASIDEAGGALGQPAAWRWTSGTGHAGTVLHFAMGSIGHHLYAVGIQCDEAAPAWAESPFAACVEGVTAAIRMHVCEDLALTPA